MYIALLALWSHRQSKILIQTLILFSESKVFLKCAQSVVFFTLQSYHGGGLA